LALALQAHRDLPAKVEEAYRAAHRLACEEWSVRQFIGGPAEPCPGSPMRLCIRWGWASPHSPENAQAALVLRR